MKFTIAYTLLFIYVIIAIVFWGYSLNKQNIQIYNLEKDRIESLQQQGDKLRYQSELQKITDKKIRRTKQYLGEGSTFILIILLTAGIVYFAYYRQRSLAKLQQNFMLSVTHELKTPISGIKLNMQTLEKRKLDEDTQKRIVQSTITETNRLDDLCNNILISTQLESTKQAIYNEEVNMNVLVAEIIAQHKVRHPKSKIVDLITDKPFYLHGDSSLWKLVVSNLVENARKYSPPESSINIVLEEKQGIMRLQVKDEGQGIADEEKDKIFQKFYRIGNENTRTSKGTGLGLFIVKKIVSLYKYDISVKNNIPKGSIFEVVFK